MLSNLQKVWVTGLAFVAISAAGARNLRQTNPWFASDRPGQEQYKSFIKNAGGLQEGEKIARPVSYSYFSSRDRSSTIFSAKQPRVTTKTAPSTTGTDYRSTHKPQEGSSSVISKKTITFPLRTVLPGNSINFDNHPYPELLEAVNNFSDLTPGRKPQEHFLVTHNTVSVPKSEDGITAVSSSTRIINGHKGTVYPYREFTETTRNAKGQRERVVERKQHLRVHHGLDEDPFPENEKSKESESKGDEDD